MVRAADQGDRPAANVLIRWTVISGGGQVTPEQSTTDADGLARTSFRLGNQLGVQTVHAELAGVESVVFTATASSAPANQLSIQSGNHQTGTVGSVLAAPIAVKLTDPYGNPKPGVMVSFTVILGGGTVSSATALSGSQGIASVQWILGQGAGAQQVEAWVPGLPPVEFDATASPGPATRMVIVGGNFQAAPPGTRLADSLVVQVVDQFDNPLPGIDVLWQPVGNAGQVSPTTVTTDVIGHAATSWILGPSAGSQTVRATAGSLTPLSFTATATP